MAEFPVSLLALLFIRTRHVVDQCLEQLQAEGLENHPDPQIGMMGGLPAVVEPMVEFADQADFFSIGTNAFIQHMPDLARSVPIAGEHGKPIKICGRTTRDCAMIPFLLGIGIRRLSLDPQCMPAASPCIGRLHLGQNRNQVRERLASRSIMAVQGILQDKVIELNSGSLPKADGFPQEREILQGCQIAEDLRWERIGV